MPSQTAATGPFDLWKDFLQNSSEFWSKAAAGSQPPDPTHLWRQFLTMWSDFWMKSFAQAPSPDTFQTAQKLWSEQLEALAQGFANLMSTEAFAAAQSKFLEQSLTWQDKLAKAMNPQTDMALRTLNLPSREQIDRLFERVTAIEERLDDLEDDTRQILRRLREKGSATPTEA
jgi:polyhydroxyalkanoate synthesis regulator phasin